MFNSKNLNNTIQLSRSEFNKLSKEYIFRIEIYRAQIAQEFSDTLEANNDLRENSTYDELILKKDFNEQRISELLRVLSTSSRIPPRRKNDNTVNIGTKIVLGKLPGYEIITYHLVSEIEANPFDNKISVNSPIGELVNGKKIGDKIKYNKIIYEILQLM
jgi:transcription elongation factor GreA